MMSFEDMTELEVARTSLALYKRQYAGLLKQFGEYREALDAAEARCAKLEKRNTVLADRVEELEVELQDRNL